MVSLEIAQVVSDKMLAMYRQYWSPLLSETIYDEFRASADDADYQEAFRRHTLVGRYAPTVADIQEQLTAIYAERRRERQQEHFSRYKGESDSTYLQMMSGEGATARASYWGGRIKEQIDLSHRIRRALAAKYSLDYSTPRANRILQAILDRARGADGLLISVEHAMYIAGQLAAERKE